MEVEAKSRQVKYGNCPTRTRERGQRSEKVDLMANLRNEEGEEHQYANGVPERIGMAVSSAGGCVRGCSLRWVILSVELGKW